MQYAGEIDKDWWFTVTIVWEFVESSLCMNLSEHQWFRKIPIVYADPEAVRDMVEIKFWIPNRHNTSLKKGTFRQYCFTELYSEPKTQM